MTYLDRSRGQFWAITSYFNPARYRRRLENYRVFRERLALPLLAIELVHSDGPDLGKADADVLIQLRSNDILWQKERLLNVAIGALPEVCSKVAWIDCDLIFASDSWVATVDALLERYALVQPFASVHMLPRDWAGGDAALAETETLQISIASVLSAGVPPQLCLKSNPEWPGPRYAFGHAWAARRELLNRFGLYDACIVGGADRAMICAAQACFDIAIDLQRMNDRQRQRYLAWAEPFHVAVQGSMTFAPGDLFHLWHGSTESRAYYDRHTGLAAFDFDPTKDLAVDSQGAWRWNSAKPDMHAYVRSYFFGRREDG